MRIVLLSLLLVGCPPLEDSDTDPDSDSDTDSDTVLPMTLSSPDFESSAGDPRASECDFVLPVAFTCDNSNPEIQWDNVPDAATHLILVFDDPSTNNYPHWAIYDIPATEDGLAAGISGDQVTNTPPAGASELVNGFDWEGYLGSCPSRSSLYRWRLFAMDGPVLEAPTGSVRAQFSALGELGETDALAVAEMCHLYTPE